MVPARRVNKFHVPLLDTLSGAVPTGVYVQGAQAGAYVCTRWIDFM